MWVTFLFLDGASSCSAVMREVKNTEIYKDNKMHVTNMVNVKNGEWKWQEKIESWFI